MGLNLAGLKMKNPVTVCSGTFGFGIEMAEFFDISKLGAITTKTITLEPREGNPQPRIAETKDGIINSIGLQNPGSSVFIRDYLPKLRKFKTSLIVNIAGNTVHEYAELAGLLSGLSGISALEINISCPNVKKGCMLFGKSPSMTLDVVSAVRKKTDLPLIAKLTPNTEFISDIAKAAVDGGADIISMINTVSSSAPVTGKGVELTGGGSGPAVKKTALKMIKEVRKHISVPIIGMGGIMNSRDARDILDAGADAVAVGTANFIDPLITLKIIKELGY